MEKLRILFVCSGNSDGQSSNLASSRPYIFEQAKSLYKLGVNIKVLAIKRKGVKGYLSYYISLIRHIKKFNPHLVHCHYGLCGFLGILQPFKKVVTTFHGSDIDTVPARYVSKLVSFFSNSSIFVNSLHPKIINYEKEINLIPCGIDLSIFKPINRDYSRKLLGLDSKRKYALFSSGFDNPIKNYNLAKSAVNSADYEITLLELEGYSRIEVSLLLNSVDFLLMTSKSEGSPQIVKEALACNCPVVSVAVGDVKELLKDVIGSYITDHSVQDISLKIGKIFDRNYNIKSRGIVKRFDLGTIAHKLNKTYLEVA